MGAAPVPANEAERMAELEGYSILDTLPEQAYDDITYLASQIFGAPIALISLVDSERQWFKSRVGLDAAETRRDLAFCAHAILDPGEILIVPDATQDARFASNPLVTSEPDIRFYAGAPLVTARGNALGTICVIDRVAREITEDQRKALAALSRQVMAQLELRKHAAEAEELAAERQRYAELLEQYQRKLEQSIEEMSEQTVTDPLTGLRNRAAFDERLLEELSRCSRHGQPLAVAMIDVDRFKDLNDTHGHVVGDQVLVRIARILEGSVRTADFVARFGGEEFVAILPNTTAEGAHILAERLRRAVEQEPWEHRPVTISVGVAVTFDGSEGRSVISKADAALYEAKTAGRNRVHLVAA